MRPLACGLLFVVLGATASPVEAVGPGEIDPSACVGVVVPTDRVLCLTNDVRQRNGVRRLAVEMALKYAAEAHNLDMYTNGFFGHSGSDGRTWIQRIVASGFVGTPVGDLLGKGFTADGWVQAMLDDPAHKSVLLAASANATGIDFSYALWTMELGAVAGASTRMTWYLTGTFDDGGKLSGQFSLDPSGCNLSPVQKPALISANTTAGTSFGGADYGVPSHEECVGPIDGLMRYAGVWIGQPPSAGLPQLELYFDAFLPLAGGTVGLHPTSVEFFEVPGGYQDRHIESGTLSTTAPPPPEPNLLAGLSLKSAVVAGCRSVTGTVTLSGPAPATGLLVALSDTLAAASLPATLPIAAGATSKSFTIKTLAVLSSELGAVNATLDGKTLSQPLTVRPIGLTSVSLTTSTVVGGQPVTGKATLECNAGPGPITVGLSSNSPGVAYPISTNVVVPQGLKTGYFDVTTNAVLTKSYATIAGTANGITKSKKLAVSVAASVSPTSLKFGSVTVGTTSAPLIATLTNKGAVPFSVVSISLTGTAAAWFAQTNDCPASLSPGASCTISATFTPLAAASKSAKLSIATSATAAPLSVSLSGTGVIPSALLVISATPTSPTTVVVRFSANIDSSTVSATAFTFHGGLTVTGFSVNGAEVTVATTTQVADAGYVVTVDSTVRDTEGNPVSTSANSAAFKGWSG